MFGFYKKVGNYTGYPRITQIFTDLDTSLATFNTNYTNFRCHNSCNLFNSLKFVYLIRENLCNPWITCVVTANLQWANLKKYDAAKDNYLIAIQLKPDFYQAMVNLASLYLDVFEDRASAKTYYSKAQVIVPHLKIEEIEEKIMG